MKLNFVLIVFLIAVYVIFKGFVDEYVKINADLKDKIDIMFAETRALSVKMNLDEREKINFLKLSKNNEVFKGTGCIQCHNTIATALPIRKISVSEAMNIVRTGSKRSLEGGMPLYLARATRDKQSITDADLKVRLDVLYTEEFLRNTTQDWHEVK
ncbi:hypothetical protein GW575_00030 [Campylobacter sp. MIT 19-121]|uniref:hypothetical protein n=1 Tax=Campylobacter sp. MIT 19-121 TaxID=2703906 RepID=UPI00138942B0|nr:hypothetical protein [Campylobacter sp. MIT 19-121]NDJ26344.1 hypothetical protein [Campylobacter sp. MIT 19-121]